MLLQAHTAEVEDIALMAENAYHEDRESGYIGMEAVSWVVVNRLNSSRFPDSIRGVIEQPSTRPLEKPRSCAFSWVCNPHTIDRIEPEALSEAVSAAYDVLSGESHYDPTMGALIYYRCELHGSQGWMKGLEFTVQKGRHCYYK